MVLQDDTYEVAMDNEFSDMIAEIPVSLAKETILEQIKNPVDIKKDNLSPVIERFYIVEELIKDDIEAKFELSELKKDFYKDILSAISKSFDIDFDIDDDYVYEMERVTILFYQLIVRDYKRNLSKFFFEYVIRNKDIFVEQYLSSFEANSDITSSALLQKFELEGKKDGIIITSFAPSIFNDICSLSIEIDMIEFMMVSKMDRLKFGDLFLDYYNSGKIIGSFVEPYLNKLNNEMLDLKNEIFTDFRESLINRFGLGII